MAKITVTVIIFSDEIIQEKYYLTGRETNSWVSSVLSRVKNALRFQTIEQEFNLPKESE